ncbi:MAG: hypothetical protein ABI840_02440 [bacterium]
MGSPLVVDIRNQAMYPINDLVKVSLRSSSSPYSIVDSGSAYSVLEGSHSKVSLFFEHATQGNSYYIVVNHRNSIETWSANPVTILGDSTVYNFTSSLSQAYGNNMILVSGVASIYSGDVNQDGSVDLSDASLVDNDSYNFVFGYVYTDVDGDGFVDASDAAIVDNNAYNFVTVVRP